MFFYNDYDDDSDEIVIDITTMKPIITVIMRIVANADININNNDSILA